VVFSVLRAGLSWDITRIKEKATRKEKFGNRGKGIFIVKGGSSGGNTEGHMPKKWRSLEGLRMGGGHGGGL